DGVGPRPPGGLDDQLDVEVALGGAGLADVPGLVGQLDVEGVPVRVGVDRDPDQAELLAGPQDAHGDLATVGNQHPLQPLSSLLRPGRDAGRVVQRPAPGPSWLLAPGGAEALAPAHARLVGPDADVRADVG